ncbi:hypothetical protein Vafri_311 [Volvox africanus]|nr:hypothetical protein Vafri_311 [Volvox africanus]
MQISMKAYAVGPAAMQQQKNAWIQTMTLNRFIAARLPVPGCGNQIRKLSTAPRALHGASHPWQRLAPFKTPCEGLRQVRRQATHMQAELAAQVHPGSPQQRPPKPQPQLQPHRQPPCISTERSRRRDLLLMTGSVLAGWVTGFRHSEMQAFAAEGITTVFVAGATGNTGRRVVQQLRQAGLYVRAGVRSTEKAVALGFGADPGIKIVEADVTKSIDTLAAAIGDAQAVVCATGAAGFGPNGASQVDEQGTINLVDAALRSASSGGGAGVRKFVLVSSLLTNAAAVGQATNPNYLFLNLFGGVLICKLKAEKYLRTSGLNYTIIRPGGLSNEPESVVGNLIVAPEDSLFALDSDPGRLVSRDTVAAVAVQAILQLDASRDKVLEVVASPYASKIAPELWFGLERPV